MTNIAGSGSISQRHGSADPDPDPHQNVMDAEHCKKHSPKLIGTTSSGLLMLAELGDQRLTSPMGQASQIKYGHSDRTKNNGPVFFHLLLKMLSFKYGYVIQIRIRIRITIKRIPGSGRTKTLVIQNT
jgi:hypothetical protein